MCYMLLKNKLKQLRSKEENNLKLLEPHIQKLTIKDVISENKLSEKAKNELNKI